MESKFETLYTNTDSTLEMILKGIENFNPDIFIYAINYGNFNKKKMNNLVGYIVEKNHRFEEEYRRLVAFGENFNSLYTTDDNKRFSTAMSLLNRIRCQVKALKDIFDKSCPKLSRRTKQEYEYHNVPYSVYSNSFMTNNSYQICFFDLKEIDIELNGAYNEFSRFLQLLAKSIKYCRQIIAQEKIFKGDIKYLVFLFKNQVSSITETIYPGVDIIKNIQDELINKNPFVVSERINGDVTPVLSTYYHNCTVQALLHYTIYKAYEECNGNEDLKQLIILYPDSRDFCQRMINIIANFDSLLPPQKNRKKVDARYVAMLHQIYPTNNLKQFVRVFERIYRNTGKYKMVGYVSVHSQLKLISESESHEFQKRINEIKMIPVSIATA